MNLAKLMTTLACATALSPAAQASSSQEFDNLKASAVKSFLAQANDVTSEVGKAIAKINIDTTDGRNWQGTISLPVKASDLQVVTVGGQEMHTPWHYAEKVKGLCLSEGNSATFNIFIDQNVGVHAAQEFETTVFEVTATDRMASKIFGKVSEVSCESLGAGGNDDPKSFGTVHSRIVVSKAKLLKAGN